MVLRRTYPWSICGMPQMFRSTFLCFLLACQESLAVLAGKWGELSSSQKEGYAKLAKKLEEDREGQELQGDFRALKIKHNMKQLQITVGTTSRYGVSPE